jgi:hypothetical protein
MRVDPALWLQGVTAYHAAVEDKAIAPGEAVPNDYYIRDTDHLLLTYRVRSNARVTVLTRGGNGPIPTTTISVAEFTQIVQGKNPKHRRLLEPKAGFWLRIAGDSVLSRRHPRLRRVGLRLGEGRLARAARDGLDLRHRAHRHGAHLGLPRGVVPPGRAACSTDAIS